MADAAPDRERASRPCPICGKPAGKDTMPFCSKRCADIDLHKWLHGVYAVPGEAAEEASEEDGAA